MKKYKSLILKIVFLIGISLLLYPIVGNIINKYKQLKVIDKYAETIHYIEKEDSLEMYNEAISYNEKLYKLQKEDTRYTLGEEYKKILKFDNTSVMGYINIPKVNIKLPIYHGVDDSVLQIGVGHVRESSFPVGTNNQNSLLMGHTGLPTSKIFTNLEKLKIDDYFKISILDHTLYYKIYKIETIEPKELIDRLYIEEGRDLVTLVTCTPYGVNSHRLVIQAERTEEIPIEENNSPKSNIYLYIGLGLGLILLLIGLYLLIRKLKNKKDILNIIPAKNVKENNKPVKNNSNKKKHKKKKKKKKKNVNNNKHNKNKKKRGKKHAKKH